MNMLVAKVINTENTHYHLHHDQDSILLLFDKCNDEDRQQERDSERI